MPRAPPKRPTEPQRATNNHENDANLFQAFRKELLDHFDRYTFSDFPSYVVRISDMQLSTREEIRRIFRPMMDSITEADFEGEAQSWYIPKLEGYTERNFNRMIQRRLKFAIFSHRWGDGEPSFQNMSQSQDDERREDIDLVGLPGYQKLLRFCEKAKGCGCEYVWSDTCCIDKTSSAELEEAITSMFRWYRNAEVCIAYLSESSTLDDFETEPWFSRGWTLQELLAPERIRFYGKNWDPLLKNSEPEQGTDTSDAKMRKAIQKRTKIPDGDLKRFIPNCDRVYEKMLWASSRSTTRVEDAAYSLLGIFDLSMPVVYGEGKRAFNRLIEIILQRSGEWGIFAWAGLPSPYSNVLPASPRSYGALDLETAKRLFPQYDRRLFTETIPISMTTFWLEVEVLIVEVELVGKVAPPPAYSSIRSSILVNEVTLRPKWSGQGVGKVSDPREQILARLPISPAFPPETWAVGIVNCRRTRGGLGMVGKGDEYLCFLLGKATNGGWEKQETHNVLTVLCTHDRQALLTTIRLYHRHRKGNTVLLQSLVIDDM